MRLRMTGFWNPSRASWVARKISAIPPSATFLTMLYRPCLAIGEMTLPRAAEGGAGLVGGLMAARRYLTALELQVDFLTPLLSGPRLLSSRDNDDDERRARHATYPA